MIIRNRTALALAAAVTAIIGLTVASASAAVIVTKTVHGPFIPSNTTDEVAFTADVSSSDLLHGVAGVHAGWKNANGAQDVYLNDGNPGGDYDAMGISALVGAAWANEGDNVSSSEFFLGAGNGAGYDLTEIQSIAAWQGAGFSNQKYDVSVRYLGDAAFTALLTVDYQPFTGDLTEGGSTKVNVTDDAGVLAGGVEAIKFTILDTASNGGGGAVFREIDVFGAATVIDPGRPDVNAGVDMTTWSGQGVLLAPTVVNNSNPLTDLTYAWSANPATDVVFDPNEFVEAPTVTITKATSNPSVVILTLAVNNVGSGKADVTDTMKINVYDTACKAAEVTTYDLGDFNKDCIINLVDFSILASKWRDNYTLTVPVAK